jgi:hypothetical protein
MRGFHFFPLTLVGFLVLPSCSGSDSGNGGTGAGGGGNFGNVGNGGTTNGGTGGIAGSGVGGVAGSTGGSGGVTGGAGGVAGGGSGGLAGAPTGGTGGSGGTSPPSTMTPGAADRFLLKGVVLLPSGPIQGEVLVEGTSITCAAASCSSQPGATGATVIETNGVISPGLIDAHNHGLFNIFDETDWTPTKLYGNHNQWTNEVRYGETVDAKQSLNGEGASPYDHGCEMEKYAGIKALIAGTTSILASAGTEKSCFASLNRSIDTAFNDLGSDFIRVSTLGVPTTSAAQTVCNAVDAGTTTAYVIHVGEGIDTSAFNEWTALVNVAGGCLIDSHTTVVHGTAFTPTQFQIMATNDMSLVWSPQSNDFLYGETTDIPAAIAAGITKIALGPDWSLGGSVNMLDELRFADKWDNDHWSNILTPKRIFEMATIEGARALGVPSYIGSIEVGKRADLFVYGGFLASAYDDLFDVTPTTVRMVMVDGRVLYGDTALQAAGPAAPGCEPLPICGVNKFLCAAETGTTQKLNQSFAQLKAAIETAMTSYDASVAAQSIAPFSPIAPLTKCP